MIDRVSDISVKSFTKLPDHPHAGVPSLDSTGMNALENLYGYCPRERRQPHLLARQRAADRNHAPRGFPWTWVGKTIFRSNIDDAIAYARKLLDEGETASAWLSNAPP